MNNPKKTRYEEITLSISYTNAKQLIEENYHSNFNPNSGLNVWDQLLACESIAESTKVSNISNKVLLNINENGNVNSNVNDTSRRKINFQLTEDKIEIISQLKKCTYRTSPFEIADLLEKLFIESTTKEGHWLYVAQHWPPRPIIRVIEKMIKQQNHGLVTIKEPPAYFTSLIKYRKKRRIK